MKFWAKLTRHTALFRGHFDMQLFWGAAVLALGLAGCQLGGTDAPPSDIAAPSAIAGPEVEVTTLAPMGSAQAVVDAAAEPKPSGAPDVAPEAKPEVKPEPPAPVIVKSASQIACEKRGGILVSVGRSGAVTCQMPTRDGGKQCRRESDCDGVCLARSNSCAPVKPLLGCHEILQNDGLRVELCID